MSNFSSKHKPRSSRGFSAILEDTVEGKLCYIQTKAETGYDAFYFLILKAEKEDEFRQVMHRPGSLDLADYGLVVASGYGRTPHQGAKDFIQEKFGLDAEELIAAAKAERRG